MKFADIIALAKAGYKPGEIKELLALQTPDEAASDDAQEPAEILPKGEAQPAPEKVEEPTAPTDDRDEEIKALKDQVAALRSDLKKAQNNNTRTDLSGEKPDTQAQLDDLVRSFM